MDDSIRCANNYLEAISSSTGYKNSNCYIEAISSSTGYRSCNCYVEVITLATGYRMGNTYIEAIIPSYLMPTFIGWGISIGSDD